MGADGTKAVGAAKLGRPRCFCEEAALDAALRVFWQKGYEGASLTDLTEAMGINRPSLYAAFGDKEALFRRVLARYAEGPGAYLVRSLEEPTARGVVEALVRGTVAMLGDASHPAGCLSVQGGMATGDEAQPIRDVLVAARRQGEALIRRRLRRAQREGDLDAEVDAADLARLVMIVLHGLGVGSAGGATRAEMHRAAEMALRGLPV